VPGSTAGITVTELEPGLLRDTAAALDRLVPADIRYAHNHGGESNGHAHVRASIIGPGVTIPLVDGSLTLGTWQQVVLIDFDDRARRREVVLQIVGE
jgi:secondary thiamine-phosphate synthase enzyme